jgi:hypothetical protein
MKLDLLLEITLILLLTLDVGIFIWGEGEDIIIKTFPICRTIGFP